MGVGIFQGRFDDRGGLGILAANGPHRPGGIYSLPARVLSHFGFQDRQGGLRIGANPAQRPNSIDVCACSRWTVPTTAMSLMAVAQAVWAGGHGRR